MSVTKVTIPTDVDAVVCDALIDGVHCPNFTTAYGDIPGVGAVVTTPFWLHVLGSDRIMRHFCGGAHFTIWASTP